MPQRGEQMLRVRDLWSPGMSQRTKKTSQHVFTSKPTSSMCAVRVLTPPLLPLLGCLMVPSVDSWHPDLLCCGMHGSRHAHSLVPWWCCAKTQEIKWGSRCTGVGGGGLAQRQPFCSSLSAHTPQCKWGREGEMAKWLFLHVCACVCEMQKWRDKLRKQAL